MLVVICEHDNRRIILLFVGGLSWYRGFYEEFIFPVFRMRVLESLGACLSYLVFSATDDSPSQR